MVVHFSHSTRGAGAAPTTLRGRPDERLVVRVICGVGGVVNTISGTFPAGGVFPPDWLSTHINQKVYAIYHIPRHFCERHPDVLRPAQVLSEVDNQSVMGVFNRRKAKNSETRALLVKRLALKVEHGFILSLKWMSTAETEAADAISRPSRYAIVRIAPAAFRVLWDDMGPFNTNLMASGASMLQSSVSGEALPFFPQFPHAPARWERMCWCRLLPSQRELYPRPPDFVFSHGHGGSQCPTPGGMQRSCGRPFTTCRSGLDSCDAARRGKVDHGGPEGGVRALSRPSPRRGRSELEVPALGDGHLRGRRPW